jgi:Fe-S cluster biogenesis protein NfuA
MFTIYAEGTPNPQSLKFVVSPSMYNQHANVQFNSAIEAKGVPLVQFIFQFPFVRQVILSPFFVSVLLHDAFRWDDLMIEFKHELSQYLNSGKTLVEQLPEREMPTDNQFIKTQKVVTQHNAPQNEKEAKIVEILDEYIRPAVEQDGGMIAFRSFNEGIVRVEMQGSCKGCPSSTMTLKSGIEALLKRLLPDDVKEVISE